MNTKTRERLERTCRLCREIGSEGEQLILIRLEDVEECLRTEKVLREMLSVIGWLDEMREILLKESEATDIYGEEEDTGETQSPDEGN